ncbi:polysaccharide pyruvyl transferase family protein [Macellibacteroides fermentans]|uniref:polysaccharide pyruvyl transferase family protein n=1 Tax=Macellibacteroides fermentans TaxID=879969 RepID=UPI00406D1AF2
MKTGIMTFHASHNCGSMLQAYALQRHLYKELGVENEIIDYSNAEQQRMYSAVYIPHSAKDIARNILNIFFYPILKKHAYDYEKFSDKFLRKSKAKYDSPDDIMSAKLDYTHLITGSDQVWNVHAKDFDVSYLLPFSEGAKKIAYAVSLGATNISIDKDANYYKTIIDDFSSVSVREKNARNWVQNLYSSGNVEICVDPTLFLTRNEWEPLVGKNEIKEKYIFWYAMTYKRDMSKIVEDISKKLGMKVYVLDAKEWSRRGLFRYGIHLKKNGGPSSFLSLIKNADLVLTSSFHGTIFSYIFQKNFWYLNQKNEIGSDDRSIYLLTQLGLQNRFLLKKDILNTDVKQSIDYSSTELIKKEIDYSKHFLQHALNK